MSSELLHNYSGQHCDSTPRSIISRIAEIGNINGPSLAGSYKALAFGIEGRGYHKLLVS